ncbi:VCBS domain-containing protein, partial [Vibrio kyushuensis]|uniref:VCBS domain-containing protein n=1 Tax=Vibrio kyushuensis TaxID=2910249 RepID=UPI003D0D4BB9
DVDTGEAKVEPYTVTNDYGTFEVEEDGSWKFTINNDSAVVQALPAGEKVPLEFEVTSFDGTDTGTISVVVKGTNDSATVGDDSGLVKEDKGGKRVASGQLDIQDVDTGEAEVKPYTEKNDYGTFAVDKEGNWTFTIDNSSDTVQALPKGEEIPLEFNVKSFDGTDSGTVSITVKGTNDSATIGDDSGLVKEDKGGKRVASGQLDIQDVDTGEAEVKPYTEKNDYGTFAVDKEGNWTFTIDNSSDTVQALPKGEKIPLEFEVTSFDGTGTGTVYVVVEGTNDGPVAINDRYDTPNETLLFAESFEDMTSTSGWTVVYGDNVGEWNATHGLEVQHDGLIAKATDGNYLAELDAHKNTSISTNIDTSGQDSIRVEFDYNPRHNGGNSSSDMTFSVGGVVITVHADGTLSGGENHNVQISGDDVNGWYQITGEFDVTGDSTEISFAGSGASDSLGALLDNISVTGIKQPDLTTEEDEPITISFADLLGNDSDIDGDTLKITDVSTAVNGSFVVDYDSKTITFTPTKDFNGEATFEYSISDDNGGSDTATVTLNVTPVNDPPKAGDDHYLNDLGDNLILNGSFEEFTAAAGTPGWGSKAQALDDWTFTTESGNGNVELVDSETGHANIVGTDIKHALDMEGTGKSGDNVTISQSVNGITHGAVYVLSLDVAKYVAIPTAELQVMWNGKLIDTITPADNNMTTYTFHVVGEAGDNTISFQEIGTSGDNSGTYLDNISLQQVNSGLTILEDSSEPLVISAEQLLGNDTDVDGDKLTITNVDQLDSDQGRIELVKDGNVVTEIKFYPAKDLNGEVSFDYEISDGNGGTDDATVTLLVVPVNDAPEFINENVDGGGYEFSYAEGMTAEGNENTPIGKVEVTDIDNTADEISFFIKSGNENGWFEINSQGEIRLTETGLEAAANDFEDAGPINEHNLVVTVNDGTVEVDTNVRLEERNVNDNQTEFSKDSESSISYLEGAQAGATLGNVTATDLDGDDIIYSIAKEDNIYALDDTNKDKPYFFVDQNGNISLTVDGAAAYANDFEQASNSHSIKVTATGTSGEGEDTVSTIDVTLSELNVNDEDTNFASDSISFNYEENQVAGATIGTVEASDKDGSNITYSIKQGDNVYIDDKPLYAVDEKTGEVSLTEEGAAAYTNDYEETGNSHKIKVTATGTDGEGDDTIGTIEVTLNETDDDSDNPPESESFTYSVNSAAKTQIVFDTAKTPIDGDNKASNDHISDEEDDADNNANLQIVITELPDHGTLYYKDPADGEFKLVEEDHLYGNSSQKQFDADSIHYEPYADSDGFILGVKDAQLNEENANSSDFLNWGDATSKGDERVLTLENGDKVTITSSNGPLVQYLGDPNASHVGYGIGAKNDGGIQSNETISIDFSSRPAESVKIGLDGLGGWFDENLEDGVNTGNESSVEVTVHFNTEDGSDSKIFTYQKSANGDVELFHPITIPPSGDFDGGTLTAVDGPLPEGAQITSVDLSTIGNGNWELRYLETEASDSFDYRAVDSDGNFSDESTVTIEEENLTPTIDLNGNSYTINFESESASHSNVFGYFTLDADGKPTSPTIIILDSNSNLIKDDLLANLESTEGLQYFLISDGAGTLGDSPKLSFSASGELLNDNKSIDKPVFLSNDDRENSDSTSQYKFHVNDEDGVTEIRVEDLSVSDGSGIDYNDLVVTLRPVTDNGTGYQTTFTEGDSGVSIVDTDIDVFDDKDIISKITIEPTNATEFDGLDSTALPSGWTLTEDSSGIFTLSNNNGQTDAADFEAALKLIQFTNASNDPSETSRTIEFTAYDNLGQQSNTATTTIKIIAVDDTPDAASNEIDTLEDQPIVLNLAHFGITDNSVEVTVKSLPVDGVLEIKGTDGWEAVTDEQVISADLIEDGSVRFTPDLHESGNETDFNADGVGDQKEDYASFDFVVSKDGNSSEKQTLTIDVTPDADAPIVELVLGNIQSKNVVPNFDTSDKEVIKVLFNSGGLLNQVNDGNLVEGPNSSGNPLNPGDTSDDRSENNDLFIARAQHNEIPGGGKAETPVHFVGDVSSVDQGSDIFIGSKYNDKFDGGIGGVDDENQTDSVIYSGDLSDYEIRWFSPDDHGEVGYWIVEDKRFIDTAHQGPASDKEAGDHLYEIEQIIFQDGIILLDNVNGTYEVLTETIIPITSIEINLPDADGSEHLSNDHIELSGIPVGIDLYIGGAQIIAEDPAIDGVQTFHIPVDLNADNGYAAKISNAELKVPSDYDGSLDFEVTAKATSVDANGSEATGSDTEFATVSPAELIVGTSEPNTLDGKSGDDVIIGDTGGDQVTITPATNYNIAILADTSGSMEGSRITLLEKSLLNFVKGLDTHEGTINLSIIGFANIASDPIVISQSDIQNGKWDDIETAINTLSTGGSTNYEAAFKSAEAWIDGLGNDSENITLMVTDGKPTTYIGDDSSSGSSTDELDIARALDAYNNLASVSKVRAIGIATDVDETNTLRMFDNSDVADGAFTTIGEGTIVSETTQSLVVTVFNDEPAATDISDEFTIATNQIASLDLGFSTGSGGGLASSDKFTWKVERYDGEKWSAVHGPINSRSDTDLDLSVEGTYRISITLDNVTDDPKDEVSLEAEIEIIEYTQVPLGEVDVVTDGTMLAAALIGELSTSKPQDLSEDTLNGNKGDDIIFGDALNGGALNTLAGVDSLDGLYERGDTEETIYQFITDNHEVLGASDTKGGDDILNGGAGNDVIYGQGGNDTIIGGEGNDFLTGGEGNDLFKWVDETYTNHLDVITDFKLGEDHIDLSELVDGNTSEQMDSFLSNIKVDVEGTGAEADIKLTLKDGDNTQEIVLQDVGNQQKFAEFIDMGTHTPAENMSLLNDIIKLNID